MVVDGGGTIDSFRRLEEDSTLTRAMKASDVRRRLPGKASADASEQNSPEEGAKARLGDKPTTQSVSWTPIFLLLLASKVLSAFLNIIHDCDETYNYWEPLHYLIHGYGLQTWEYSAEFGLRSYLYLLLHAVIAFPASLLFGDGPGKVYTFLAVRLGLAILSALSEAWLAVAASRWMKSRSLGWLTALLLAGGSGTFTASTSFLPSTFSMYGLTASAAALLSNRPATAVALAAAGVTLGWPFSILATVPIVLFALFTGGFWKVFAAGAVALLGTLVPSALIDRFFYGTWQVSLWNIVRYNAGGGGDSHLYGVEPASFYLRNLVNNFNLALPLALVAPVMILLTRKPGYGRLLVGIAPLYLWLGAMSCLPHKEERFLYIVYPLLCLAAAASLAFLPDILRHPILRRLIQAVQTSLVILTLLLSASRTASLLINYSAPFPIYRHLASPAELAHARAMMSARHAAEVTRSGLMSGDQTAEVAHSEYLLRHAHSLSPAHIAYPPERAAVCVGAEWYRSPGSFFLPSSEHRLAFLDEGFGGLLPFPFNGTAGGTRARPGYFNDRNRASPGQFLSDQSRCDYRVDFRRKGEGGRDDDDLWEVVAERPFLDAAKSPALSRAFYVPGWSAAKNKFGTYRLSRRKR
ncbi:alpha-1,2-mannosyltransferase [Klebsormidium nitens]|uniref:Mannosyltransferase n=1 Tax=Klebsormidium nitens TaxID=105231 RepID=A0A1Y1ILE4_KLENI|nr:alpha-1,2-mannosyltransferase [Klebsormidium nitens]|eukprot:GAQ89586.1 alpha-1,2-mannosyltransferase [Klebsormidium nitens]